MKNRALNILNLSKALGKQRVSFQRLNEVFTIKVAIVILLLSANILLSQSGNCSTTTFPDQWQIHNLQSSELPYRSVYILPQEDLDGDGLKDITTGGWWYKNPGSPSGNWVRNTIGNQFNNIAHIHDFDNDGDMDLLGTTGAYTGADLVWAENNGSGSFTIHNNIPSGNTNYSEPFLAGIAGAQFQSGGPYQMAINWNGAESTGSPVEMLTVPADPVNTTWSLDTMSPDSLGEDMQKGDIDGDGDLDLFQSSNWLRNNGNGTWTTFSTGISYVTTPDRAQLADFDGDGDLDAVVGQLSLGSSSAAKTEFAWFEAPANPTQTWTKHILATDINGSLSVVASDIDQDGDKDIIVGEWKGSNRLIAFQNDLCNSGTWIRKTINAGGTGFDHHDGAQVVDIDNDGDLDVISIGWDNIVPRIFENTSSTSNVSPIANAGQDQSITLPINAITLNGSGSDPDGGSVSYQWTQQSGPNIAVMNDADSADLTVDGLIEGDYIFRLTITDNENETAFDDVTLTVFPEVVVELSAKAEATPLTGTAPLEITFTGSNSSGEIMAYSWDFKDGNSSEEADPVHLFSDPGIYEVTLTVSDDGDIENTDMVTINVTESGIELSAVADATPLTGTFPLEVTFTGSNSTGEIASYLWDFKDGNTSDETDPVHTFSDAGTYDVALTVADSGGMINTTSVTINVGSGTALLAIAEATPLTGTFPLEVTFTGSNSTGEIASYLWDFKDGNTSDETDPVHTFSDAGTYEVALTVADSGGMINTTSVIINVGSGTALLAIADATPLTGTFPLEVTFTGSNSTGEIASYLWDFKDGNTSDDADPVHTFTDAGTYEIALTVTDNGGMISTTTVTINVGSGTALLAIVEATPLTGTFPLEVTFAGSNSTGEIASYLWDFKDGNTSDEIDPVHTFTDAGTYEITLTVTDNGGLISTTTVTINVGSGTALLAIAEATPLTGTFPLEVTFTGSNSTGEIASYLWDFKDGNTSDEIDPVHTFTDAGTYEITLTVTDNGGGTSTTSVTINVGSGTELLAIVEATPLTGTFPLEVTFTGSNSTGEIASYLWDFKDSNTSDETNPAHTFSDPGTYEVLLTVTDETGTTSSAVVKITVADLENDEILALILENNPSKNGLAKIRVLNRPDDFNVIAINLHDQQGRLIGSFTPDKVQVENTYQIPVHSLRDGLYYFNIEIENNEEVTLKLIVKNTL